MDADILQAIQIIDAKIASLQEARNRLAHAFGVDQNTPSVPAKAPTEAAAPKLASPQPTPAFNQANPVGRKEQLAKFLLEHGPMPRGVLYERAGIPEGTVSYCLNDKRFFVQLENGDWSITEFSRRGLERRTANGAFHLEHQ